MVRAPIESILATSAHNLMATSWSDANSMTALHKHKPSPHGSPDMLVVETIVTGPDEVCFWFVEAASEHEITGAFRAIGVPIDRISPGHRVARGARREIPPGS